MTAEVPAGPFTMVIFGGAGDLAGWTEVGTRQRLWHLIWLVAAGGGTYLLVVLAVGIRPKHLLHG